MPDWLFDSTVLWWLGAASVGMLILGALAVPWLAVSIPADYFVGPRPPDRWRHRHPVLRWTVLIAKNIAGACFAIAGIVMIFTPGQGVLSILLGLSLLNLPGKRAIERWIVGRPRVLATINALRKRAGRPPLQLEAPPEP